eukprot:GHVT01082639.1.p1 GENE.GHVT01082639.1~~GHVT01082639.1.p1  ORF type:complete len:148 (-),score=7.75 GHVT01082639.1:875-1318(-)
MHLLAKLFLVCLQKECLKFFLYFILRKVHSDFLRISCDMHGFRFNLELWSFDNFLNKDGLGNRLGAFSNFGLRNMHQLILPDGSGNLDDAFHVLHLRYFNDLLANLLLHNLHHALLFNQTNPNGKTCQKRIQFHSKKNEISSFWNSK